MLWSTFIAALGLPAAQAAYSWNNVHTGGGGGFTPGIVFSTAKKGVAYARTDIGGLYRLNSDDSWTPLTDWANNTNWGSWGIDALAADPSDANTVYAAVGMYTNSWDPNNGTIIKSTNQGTTWSKATLPFKCGGNMPGRGMGERLAVDPHNSKVLYFGARSDKGLWKSIDAGATWSQVNSFPKLTTYQPDPTDTSGLNSDHMGIAWVTFNPNSTLSSGSTSSIFVGVATNTTSNIYVSNDAGSTWSALAGQPDQGFFPHKGKLGPAENALYVSYTNGIGPYDGTNGEVWRYDVAGKSWKNISPTPSSSNTYGFGGIGLDLQKPGTLIVATLNQWWPDQQIYRSNDSGTTWSPLWEWTSYPNQNFYYSLDNSVAPWVPNNHVVGEEIIGWMMESLEIDPFDSNHWLYGTGKSVYGGHDLTDWDTKHNITIQVLASGIEETAVEDLIAPPGLPLVSAVGDIAGWQHQDITKAPLATLPFYGTATGLDYAGNVPKTQVLIGGSPDGTNIQISISKDAGSTWVQNTAATTSPNAGKVAVSANATTILWSTGNAGVLVSNNNAAFSAVSALPSGAVIASDKRNDTVFYGSSGGSILVSTNSASTFSAPIALGSSTTISKIVANPTVAGDVWVSTDKGLWHSTNYGKTWTGIGTSGGYQFALGVSKANTYGYDIFGFFVVNGVTALYQSTDVGKTWTMISDAQHGFGSASGNPVTASLDMPNMPYIGTNGRGIFWGMGS